MSSWSSWTTSQSTSSLQETSNRHNRSSNTSSISGSPRPSLLARPHWPWTSHSHRPSNSPSPLPSSLTSGSTGTPALAERTLDSIQWSSQHQPLRPASSTASVQQSSVMTLEESSTRQWNFTAFEWTIRNVAALKDYVEGSPQGSEDSHSDQDRIDGSVEDDSVLEVLKQCPLIGDGKFKVEVARSFSGEERSSTPTSGPTLGGTDGSQNGRIPALSLYITGLFLDFSPPDHEFCAAMMVAIKCQEDRAGERGARSDWVWEFWDQEFVFRRESEFWECQLPTLSTLLRNPRIAERDSLVLCIQIHSPIGPLYPQFPQAYYVPRDLLEGLEASLDNPNTGDVRFVTLEYNYNEAESPDTDAPHSRRSSSSSSYRTRRKARKRVIYAHSDILKRRSEYFATMLNSAFAESATAPSHPHADNARRVHDIFLLEADFITVYWMLKWLYADWLLFKEEDDPRHVVSALGDGWSAKWLTDSGLPNQSEWDWKTIPRHGPVGGSSPAMGGSDSGVSHDGDEGDSRGPRSVTSASARSGASIADDGNGTDSGGKGKAPAFGGPSNRVVSTSTSLRAGRSVGASSSSRGTHTSSATRRTSQPAGTSSKGTIPIPVHTGRGNSSTGFTSSSKSRTQGHFSSSTSVPTPLSPHQGRTPVHTRGFGTPSHSMQPTPDPHSHPTQELPPASALAIYQIAHRYSMPGLQSLALEHMMNTITPKSAFPLLLATNFLDELHSLVEDYIVEHFAQVNRCDAFEKCCKEIAAGGWGDEGGSILVALFRRLTPSNTVRFRA